MKINNKQILTIIVATVVILVAFYAYSVRARMVAGEVDGYLVLIDREGNLEDYAFLRQKLFSTTINLPGDDCTGTVNYCSYEFPAGTNADADLNNDGKIDAIDIQIFQQSFGCNSTKPCWSQPIDRCYYSFSTSGRNVLIRDPDHDCNMTQSDIQIFQRSFGNNSVSTTCETSWPETEECMADVNKDGKVNMYDAVIIASKYGKYADTWIRLVEHESQADVNKNAVSINKIDILDAIIISLNYGKQATNQQCVSSPLTHVSGNQYGISITARGLYFAGVTYSCVP